MQKALLSGPGRFSSIVCYQRRDGVSDALLKTAAAELIQTVALAGLPQNLDVLVALRPDIVDKANGVGPTLLTSRGLPDQAADLVVQVAAQTEIDRLIGLRLAAFYLSNVATGTREISGSRLLNGQESFGFKDGASPSPARVVDAIAPALGETIGREALQSYGQGTWLLFQRYRQKVTEFFSLSDTERANVMGRPPASVKDPTKRGEAAVAGLGGGTTNSHWNTMTSSGRNPPAMLRRGFPCRIDGEEGLAFVAVAEDPAVIGDSLDRFNTTDAMKTYVQIREGGVFFCPPDARSLDPNVTRRPLPGEVQALTNRKASLVTYEVAEPFLEYMLRLKDDGIFVGSVGAMTIAPAVIPIVQQLNETVANLSANPAAEKTELARLAQASQDDANSVNESVGGYHTFN